MDELLASKEQLNCGVCFPEDGASIVDYYNKLRMFLRFRADLWHELLQLSVMEKLLSLGRLVIVCLPEIGRTGCMAIIFKVYFKIFAKVSAKSLRI